MTSERPLSGHDLCPSCGATWLISPHAQRVGCANAACDLRMRLPHRPEPGDEFMPAGWCGGCEVCSVMSPPTICLACTYEPNRPLMSALFPGAPPDLPQEPVLWKDCPQRSDFDRAQERIEADMAWAILAGMPVLSAHQRQFLKDVTP